VVKEVKKQMDPVIAQYIEGLLRENRLQDQLIKQLEKLVGVLDEENAALRSQMEELLLSQMTK
jgi:hypothetical protein